MGDWWWWARVNKLMTGYNSDYSYVCEHVREGQYIKYDVRCIGNVSSRSSPTDLRAYRDMNVVLPFS